MNQEKYIHLIYLQLQDNLSSSEAQELDTWLNQSTDNQKIKEEIIQSMDLMEDFKPGFEIDMEGDYAKIEAKLDLRKNKAKVVPMASRRRWIGLAVAVALLLVTAFIFRNGLETDLEWQIAESTSQANKEVTLAEGTTVLLNKNSRLDYPKAFTGKTRPVKLEGEGFFKVKRNTDQPFKVIVNGAEVEVLGTAFGVRAHPHEDKTIVSVESGKVAFRGTESGQSVILLAGEEAVFDKKLKTVKKLAIANPNALSYQSGALVFKNTPLPIVFQDLERHFDVKIDFQNAALKGCAAYSMTKQKTNLETVFNALKILYKIDVKAVDGKYIVSGGGC